MDWGVDYGHYRINRYGQLNQGNPNCLNKDKLERVKPLQNLNMTGCQRGTKPLLQALPLSLEGEGVKG